MRAYLLLPLLALPACDGRVSTEAAPTKPGAAATGAVAGKEGLALSVSADGKTASVNIGDAAGRATEKSNIDLMPIAAPLPGATATATERRTEDGARKEKTTYTTAQSPADVAAVFDARIKAAGASPIVSAAAGDNIARVVASQRGAVAIGIEPEGGATKVVVETTIK